MNQNEIIAMAKEAGFDNALGGIDGQDELRHFAALVAAKEREEIAPEFDKRAVLRDGGPAVGWYEPDEPAEIVRARGTKEGA